MNSFVTWTVASVSGAAFFWFFVRPWIGPLYARYRAWVQRVAAGKQS